MPLTDDEKLKERIWYNTEFVKLLVVILIATVSGVLSILLDGAKRGRDVLFAAGGILVAVFRIVVIFQLNQVIKKLIKDG